MIYFIYHFIVDSFLTGTLEPTNDQLPTSVASSLNWLERRTGIARSRIQTPLKNPEFFRLLYAIAKIAFITARIIASFEHSFINSFISFNHFISTSKRGTLKPQVKKPIH